MVDPVEAAEAQARAHGIEVSDRDRERIRGDREVNDHRMMAKALREDMLRRAGFEYKAPTADGIGVWDNVRRGLRVICSIARQDDDRIWAHVSVSRRDKRMPTFEDLRFAKESVFPDRVALQVFPPTDEWYSYGHSEAPEVLHLFICLTERPTPDFRGSAGTL